MDLVWRLKPFTSLAMPYFRENRSASIQIVVLICLTLLTQLIYVVFSYIQRDIFNSLVDKNSSQFYLVIPQELLTLLLKFQCPDNIYDYVIISEYIPIHNSLDPGNTNSCDEKVSTETIIP